MALSDEQVVAAIKRSFSTIQMDAERLHVLRDYHRGEHMRPRIPSSVDPMMMQLVERATTNLMPLAVNIPAQMSFIDGFSRVAEGDVDLNPPEWGIWLKAGMRSRQTTLFRTSLKYGQAFVLVDPVSGLPKLLPTFDTTAFFEDPVNDLVPLFALTVQRYTDDRSEIVFMDDSRIVRVPVNAKLGVFDDKWLDSPDVTVEKHRLGHCPVVRFTCELDDEGSATGLIEPLIPSQDRVNQSAFDLLVNQSYGSFQVRYAAGLTGDPEVDEDGNPLKDADGQQIYKPVEISQARLLMSADSSAKFGTLDATPVSGFIEAFDNAVRSFAVRANIPPHSLLGSMNNLSGETIEAAMGQTNRFVKMLQASWSESVNAVMMLIRAAWGFPDVGTADYQVRWRDMSDHSMSQIVDALGKASQMLGVPGEGLWGRIPGVTAGDILQWREMASEASLVEELDGTDAVSAAAREPVTLGLMNGVSNDSASGAATA